MAYQILTVVASQVQVGDTVLNMGRVLKVEARWNRATNRFSDRLFTLADGIPGGTEIVLWDITTVYIERNVL